ncbi:MAG: SBBP repeat-containing protein [Vicinamibacterales bacterium]
MTIGMLAAGVLSFGPASGRLGGPHDAGTAGSDPARALRGSGRNVAFEENRGQHDARARFVARGANFSVFVTDRDVTLALPVGTAEPPAAAPERGVALRLAMVGARGDAAPTGEAPLAHRVNYLKGRDPANWVTGARTYGRVRQGNLRPGVDVVWYASDSGTLEYDVVVAPAVDPSTVEFDIDGATGLEVTEAGTLRIHTDAGVVEQDAPTTYQEDGGVRSPVDSGYELRGPARVGFRVGAYDDSRTLVIDPNLSQLAFSTYLGGSDRDSVIDVAVDGARNVYVAGTTTSVDFPTTTGAFDPVGDGVGPASPDVFVTKLNAAGTTAIYSTYLGGSLSDFQPRLAVDAGGRAHVVGDTYSSDFPVTPGAFDTMFYASGFGVKTFVAKLTANGAALEYSTFLGGYMDGGSAAGADVAVDVAGNAYVAGVTFSTDFPTTPGAFDTSYNGNSDFFVTKLDPTGANAIYSTFLGGTGVEGGYVSIALAGSAAIVAGETTSYDFPVPATAFDSTFNLDADGVVALLNTTGSGLIGATYLGGAGSDVIHSVAWGTDGFVYVAGLTASTNFPTTPNAFDQTLGGPLDGFVAKLALTLGTVAYATLLGGSANDAAFALALQPRQCVPGFPCPPGHVVVIGGITTSSDFPVSSPTFDATLSGGTDGFVTLLNQTGTAVGFSTFYGGTSNERLLGVTVDTVGNVFVGGISTLDGNGIPVAGDSVLQKTPGGGASDGFVAKLGTYVVSGRILDRAGQPVPGVTVYATQGFSASTTTDALGFYVLDTPPTGSYRVTPSLPGATFSPSFRQFTNPQSNRVANFTRLP